MPLYLAQKGSRRFFYRRFYIINPCQRDAALPYTKGQPPVLLPAAFHHKTAEKDVALSCNKRHPPVLLPAVLDHKPAAKRCRSTLHERATAGSFTDGSSLKNPRQKNAALPCTKRQPPVLLPVVLDHKPGAKRCRSTLHERATAGSFTDGSSLKNPWQKDAALPCTKRQPPVLLPAVHFT